MKKSLIIVITLLFAAAFTNIHAQPMKGERGNKVLLKERLNLTDAQMDKVEELKYSHQEQMIELKADMQKHKLSVKKYMQQENFEPNNLMEMTDEGLALQSKMKKMKTQHWIDIYNLLDDSQKETFKEHFGRSGKMIGKAHRFGMHRSPKPYGGEMHQQRFMHRR